MFVSDIVCDSALSSRRGTMEGFCGLEQGGPACFPIFRRQDLRLSSRQTVKDVVFVVRLSNDGVLLL